MTRTRRIAGILLATTLVLGTAACGDDDEDDVAADGTTTTSADDGGSGSASASAAGADFCDSLRTFHGAIFETQLEDDAAEEEIAAAHEKLDPLWTSVEASATDAHEDAITELSAAIDALAEGNVEPFNDDATAETYFGLLADVVPDCVEDTVEVTGIDYAFEGVPQTFPAGESGIVFSNDSEAGEEHEFIIFKKAEGDDRTAQEILEDPKSQEEGPGEFSGAVFASPGKTAASFLDLAAGDYIAVCFIPVGGGEDGEEGPPHFTRGMLSEFTVE